MDAFPAKFYAGGKCRYSAIVRPFQNTLTLCFSYGIKDLDNHSLGPNITFNYLNDRNLNSEKIKKTPQNGWLFNTARTSRNKYHQFDCVFRSIRSRIGIEVRSAIRIHSINRELNFFYRFLTRFFDAFHYRGIFLRDSP
ncbi:hypothetical protein EC12741_A0255 [Escherichia coli 1.2741]|nr:hypothetical protein EC12741_A0255 [Escherichia coli 1.2741]